MANEVILLVEDDSKSRKLVRDLLTFKGYEIIEAESKPINVKEFVAIVEQLLERHRI
jgi:CheY-like chemotaxis protein